MKQISVQWETTFRVTQISVEYAMASSAVEDELETTRVYGLDELEETSV
jgi:hypothetical protein